MRIHNIFASARSTLLWLVWLSLVAIWVCTLAVNAIEGHYLPAIEAGLDLGLMYVLYYAEGIELAITDLLDKEPSRLRNPKSKGLLTEIRRRPGFFFAQRQVFVVVIISVVSLTTSYTWIFVPFYGKLATRSATFWFSLLFTSLTVLWFCQVTPKRLAIVNSEVFLSQTGLTWRMIKSISVLGLPDPSDLLVRAIRKRTRYAATRHLLPPGHEAHYDISVDLLGLALDRVETTLTIAADGSGTLRKRMMFLLQGGRYESIQGAVESTSARLTATAMEIVGAYLLPATDRVVTIAGALETAFRSGGSSDPSQAWRVADLTIHGTTPPQSVQWLIENDADRAQLLAEQHTASGRDGVVGHPADEPMTAVVCELHADVDFDLAGEFLEWSEVIGLPCRSYTISIDMKTLSGAGEAPPIAEISDYSAMLAGTEMLLIEEIERTQAAVIGTAEAVIAYPLQGARYTVKWRHNHIDRGARSAIAMNTQAAPG